MIEDRDLKNVSGNAFYQIYRQTESYLNAHIRSVAAGATEQLRRVISNTENLGDPVATIDNAASLTRHVAFHLDRKIGVIEEILKLSAGYASDMAMLFANGEIPMPGIEDLLAQPPALGTETQEPAPDVPRRIKVRKGEGKPGEQDTMGFKPLPLD